MAILLLQHQGRLNVHDKLCRYMDGCPAAWSSITLEQLLTHTSGIPDYTNFSDFPRLIGIAAKPLELIERFKGRPLDFTPGSQ